MFYQRCMVLQRWSHQYSSSWSEYNLCKSSRSSRPEVFLGKVVLKICTKFTGEHSCRSVISIKLLCSFIEIKLRHGCSPVNLLRILKQFYWNHTPAWVLLHIFRTIFLKNTSGRLLLVFLLSKVSQYIFCWHKPIAFSQCHVILKLCYP